MDEKICKVCKKSKLLSEFWYQKRNNIIYYCKKCKLCDRERILAKNLRYKNKNRENIAQKQRTYHSLNKENDAATKHEWYQKNKSKVLLKVKKHITNRRIHDVNFKLKERVSVHIRHHLKKDRLSSIKYLSYSIQELKEHLEKQFEPWMSWDNWGQYLLDFWKDDDSTTWTWQIDHIIPQNKLPYTSMEDENFKKCWALENLRPYSAKQNIIDGAR